MLFDEILIALSKRDDYFHFTGFCGIGIRWINSSFFTLHEISNNMVSITSGDLIYMCYTLDEALKAYDDVRKKFINGYNNKGENQNEKW